MVGGVAAILNIHVGRSSQTWTHSWCVGMEVTQYNTTIYSLAKAMEWLVEIYNTISLPCHTYVLSLASLALSMITNVCTLNNHSLSFFSISSLLLCAPVQHQEARFTLAWVPQKSDQIQDSMDRFQALAAARQTPHMIVTAQHSAAYQQALACKQMFAAWAQEWVQTCQQGLRIPLC